MKEKCENLKEKRIQKKGTFGIDLSGDPNHKSMRQPMHFIGSIHIGLANRILEPHFETRANNAENYART